MTPRTGTGILAAAVVTVIGGVGVDHAYENGHIQWGWLALALLAATLGGGVAMLHNRAPNPDPSASASADAQSLDVLAKAVERVWAPEERHRRLLNPHPLPTAWTTVGPPLSDHWANVRADGIDEPLDLDDVVDRQHPDAFHRLVVDPRLCGRAVILGEPGAGKTALLLRLTLTLLRAREPGERVPVLLRLSTWNPAEQTLARWVAARLVADYGHRRPAPAERLLPVLDGLDEMPAHHRKEALRAIGAAFAPDRPLLLTSRITEYLDTLTALEDHVLPAAVVVELVPLPAEVVCDYLSRAAAPAHAPAWRALFERDRHEHDGRLAAALDAPLWVDLARATYTGPDRALVAGSDPAELLGLPDAEAVHGRLLDRLIPAAYPDNGDTWRRSDAQRWLGALATGMRRRGSLDLAWWELARTVPGPLRPAVGLGAGLGVAYLIGPTLALLGVLALGLAFGLGGAARRGIRLRLARSAAFGLVAGFAGGLLRDVQGEFTWVAFGLALGVMIMRRTPPTPSRGRIHLRRTKRPVFLRLARALGLGLGLGLAVGFGYALGGGLGYQLDPTSGIGFGLGVRFSLGYGLDAGLALGFGVGFVYEFSTFFREGDADVATATDPLRVLRDDRRRVIVGGLALGLAVWFSVGFVDVFVAGYGVMGEITYGFWFAFVPAFTVGLAFRFAAGAWGQFLLARVWLASSGRLPWRLMAFLADAHRRGVLRQAGGVYQFRHALLRDRLAVTAE